MMSEQEVDVNQMLSDWQRGDLNARDALFETVYSELKQRSASLLQREGAVSLSPGDVVNEALIRMIKLNRTSLHDKAHFMALSARMMRRVLIEHARHKHAAKREHRKVTLITAIPEQQTQTVNLLKLDEALQTLQSISEPFAEIVEMRYFGGLSLDEIAQVTSSSKSTVQRRWRAARAWLRNALQEV